MTIFVPKSPFGYTIFCDEIRQENNGKLIYIGVYTGEMLFYGPPPGVLPTFTAMVYYVERREDKREPVSIKLFAPGILDAIGSADLNINAINFSKPPSPIREEEEPSDPIFGLRVPIRVAPMIVDQEGAFRVRAFKGGDVIRLGTLSVKFNHPLPAMPPAT